MGIMHFNKEFRWSLSKKLIMAFVIIICTLMIFIISANSNFNKLLNQYNLALENNKTLGEYFDSITTAHQYLRNSFVEDTEEMYLKEYNKCYELLREMRMYINDQYSYGKLIDLERMQQSYGEKAEEALDFFTKKETELANKSLNEARDINALILGRYGYYAKILNKTTETRRLDLLQWQERQNVAYWLIIISLIIFCASFAGVFINSVTKPVKKLAENAEQISKGNFELPQIEVKTKDEIRLLSTVFNNMVQNIKYYIKEIENKAELQERLMVEENKNLRNEALLKQTQLNALQAQINPHFLFNTLNMIKQTAFLEDAAETRVMLETTAQLLRFYLDKAGMDVFLKEELENVDNYIYIQNKRMGKRIKFNMVIDQNITNIQMPALIIQPLLENAILHGLEDCIRDGEIEVRVLEQDDCIKIEVKDNGIGMSTQTIQEITNKKYNKDSKSIGIANVLQRLELFYDKEGLMEIDSKIGAGTTITLTLLKIIKEKDKLDV